VSTRVSAVSAATGGSLLDITVSLVTNPRARRRDPDAVPAADVTDQIIAALGGRTLICWSAAEVWSLGQAVPYDWPDRDYHTQRPRMCAVEHWSTCWRAQMTITAERIVATHPGTAERLWLHLVEIADTA